MYIWLKSLFRFFPLIVIFSFGNAVEADAPPGTEDYDRVTREAVVAERAKIEVAQNLREEQRKQMLAKLDEAALLLEQADQLRARSVDLETQIKQAPGRLAELRKASGGASEIVASQVSQWNVERLKATLERYHSELENNRAHLDGQEKALASYILAAKSGGAEVADVSERLEKLQPPTPGLDTSQSTAERLLAGARRQMLAARLAWLKLRQNNLEVLTELATAQRDYYVAQTSVLQRDIDWLRAVIREKQETTLKAAQAAAEDAKLEVPPELKSLQGKIAGLLKEKNELLAETSLKEQRLDSVKRLLDELQADQQRIQQALELAGDSEQISTLLQKRRAVIPSVSALTENVIDYQSSLSTAVLRQLALDEKLRETSSATAYIDMLLAKLPENAEQERRAALRREAEQAWTNYRGAVQDLIKDYNGYVARLSTLEATTRQLIRVARDYQVFIDERLLWMPSTGPIPLAQPKLLLNGFQWLIRPEHLTQLIRDSRRTLLENRLLAIVYVVVMLVLAKMRRRAISGLKAAASATLKVRTDSFMATLSALLYTLVLTLPLPALFWGIGILLGASPAVHDYTLSVAAGFQGIGLTLLILTFLRHLCRDGGLAVAHLQWRTVVCKNIRGQATWLVPLAIPLSFLFSASTAGVPSAFILLTGAAQEKEPGVLAFGRLAFIILMFLLVVAIYRIWRKGGPVMQELTANSGATKWVQYHVAWFAPAVFLPLGFALASMAGYYYSATFLVAKAGQTLWFVIGLALLKGLLMRGLYVSQRRLRFKEALRVRDEMRAQRAAADVSAQEVDNLPVEEDKIHYGQLSDQVRQLLRLGYGIGLFVVLWWIWKDVVPALSVLNAVEIPLTTSIVADGVSREVPLTLGSLVVGLLFGGLTLLAARSIPGLMEFTLLQRLPMGRASRYALTTLTQYLVVMIGLVIAFKTLGLQWSNIQWLIAALSVGLGFGLQEIVANFVSGVILLFEQPIRVGDVVTVEGTSGTVSRIRIRATTIVNWDRQELIIPNKAFITGQLINWTLSDTLNRVVITVGVAYGSDTRKAMALMREAAEEHPKVLKDPVPRITFEGFGDNSLTLLLRAYLDDIDARLPTITDLHQAINDKFEAAGIVIAFPQRDVHLDTSQPLELVLRREAVKRDGDNH